jgi:hypothetical protein
MPKAGSALLILLQSYIASKDDSNAVSKRQYSQAFIRQIAVLNEDICKRNLISLFAPALKTTQNKRGVMK